MRKGILILLSALFFLSSAVTVASPQSDALVQKVIDKLESDPSIGAHNIEIKSSFGTLTLSGEVASAESRARIEFLTSQVEGVQKVVNNLEVRTHEVQGETVKSGYAEAILQQVKASEMTGYQLAIHERNGKVVLSGAADSQDKINRLVQIARSVPGITQVESELSVKSFTKTRPVEVIPDTDIQQNIQRALQAENALTSTVQFTTKGGIVHFSGNVPAHAVIDKMLSIALNTDGVKEATSEVVITGGCTELGEVCDKK